MQWGQRPGSHWALVQQPVDTSSVDVLSFTKSEPENNLDALQLKNGLRKCGTYAQWSTTQQRKNNIMKFAGKWMELENIILSEITQTQKDKPDSPAPTFFPIPASSLETAIVGLGQHSLDADEDTAYHYNLLLLLLLLLLWLGEPATITEAMRVLSLPTEEPELESLCLASGWGSIRPDKSALDVTGGPGGGEILEKELGKVRDTKAGYWSDEMGCPFPQSVCNLGPDSPYFIQRPPL
ncbi:hypothetical protein STEG23_018871 [Scotinomys teguina]